MGRGDGTMYMANMSAAAPSAEAVLSPWTIEHLRSEVERLRSTYAFAPIPEAPACAEAPSAEPPMAPADATPSDLAPEPQSDMPAVAMAAAVAVLSRKLDLIDAKSVDPIAIARLQRQTAELKDLIGIVLARVPAPADEAEAAQRLEQAGAQAAAAITHAGADFGRAASEALERLEERLELFAAARETQPPVAGELVALRERLDTLSQDVRALGAGRDEGLAARITVLLDRMDQGETVEVEALAPLVGVLERHLVTLTERMGNANQQLARLDGIESLLKGLTGEIQRLHRGSIDPAADDAAPLPQVLPVALPVAGVDAQDPVSPVAADLEDREDVPADLPAAHGAALEPMDDVVDDAELDDEEIAGRAAPMVSLPAAPLVDWPRREPRDELASLLAQLADEVGTRPAQGRPTQEAVPVWQVTEAPWQGELREMLATAEQRRRAHVRPFADERLDLGALKPGADWASRHVAALEAALMETAAEEGAPGVRVDWVAAADRAEDREKGAALERKRRSTRRLNVAARIGAVALVAAGLGFVTLKLTQRDGAGLSLQAVVSAPAIAALGGGAPVDKALLGTLPPPVGPAALKQAAIAGDADAACEVGIRYADGKGTDVDSGAAMRWLAFAASRGSVPAAYRLGSMYEYGTRNLAEARRLYQWAADHGNLRAMHNLGVLYSDGIDGKPDWQNAVNWFRKAAELGLRDSQYNLGVVYARGLAGAVDRAEAWKWFSLAANQGDTESARKRDDVANKAEGGVVERAKAAAAAFVPGKAVESANTVPVRPEWEVAGPADTLPRKSASR